MMAAMGRTGDRGKPMESKYGTRLWIPLALLVLCAAYAQANCTLTSTGKTPLNDLGPGSYLGAQGGLYPGGANTRPSAHAAAGLQLARETIQPLAADGAPDPVGGKIVLISIGMSNTTQEFATRGPGAFRPRALADPSRNPRLVIVDCAQGAHAAKEWRDPQNEAWVVADQRLANVNVTPAQVQVAWVKLAERTADLPDRSFPAHAELHADNLKQVLHILKSEYPNTRIVYFSSRTRSYQDNPDALNPEPIAYESGFSVKWLIDAQIAGAPDLNYDPERGPVVAPFLVWGPYLWIDGEVPRSDGMVWLCSDLVEDFTHPSEAGVTKVGDQLLAFFKSDPLAAPWFLRSTTVGSPPSAAIVADVTGGAAPLTVHFAADALDPDGTIVSTAWRFDDGTHSLLANPAKVFPVAGEYAVHLTVTDNDGNPATTSRTMLVGPSLGTPTPTATTALPTLTPTPTATIAAGYSVSITFPWEGQTVSGVVIISGTTENLAEGRVQVAIDNGPFERAEGRESWAYSWNTTQVANGPHTIRAAARACLDCPTAIDAVTVQVHNNGTLTLY